MTTKVTKPSTDDAIARCYAIIYMPSAGCDSCLFLSRTHAASGMDPEVGEHLVIADVHVMLIRKVVEALAASGPDISEREKRRTALNLRETLEVCTSHPPPRALWVCVDARTEGWHLGWVFAAVAVHAEDTHQCQRDGRTCQVAHQPARAGGQASAHHRQRKVAPSPHHIRGAYRPRVPLCGFADASEMHLWI